MQTNINSQPRKLSSPTKSSKRNAETVLKLTTNAWWPFNRADGKLLERMLFRTDEATAASFLPDGLDRIFFTNSGSEAVEGALKVAKRFTRRTEIIACHNAYHGSTHGAIYHSQLVQE